MPKDTEDLKKWMDKERNSPSTGCHTCRLGDKHPAKRLIDEFVNLRKDPEYSSFSVKKFYDYLVETTSYPLGLKALRRHLSHEESDGQPQKEG